MSGSESDRGFVSIPIKAANDFTANDKMGRAVTRGGEFADNGLEAIGIVNQLASSGQTMSVAVAGLLKYRPIDVVSAGYKLTVIESGFFQAAAANTYTSGIALGASSNDDANVTSNALGTGHFMFAVREYISTISGGDFAA